MGYSRVRNHLKNLVKIQINKILLNLQEVIHMEVQCGLLIYTVHLNILQDIKQ
jgi:hypothetical protein